jgi:hypothetical protein
MRHLQTFLIGLSQRPVEEESSSGFAGYLKFVCPATRAVKTVSAEYILRAAEAEYLAELFEYLADIGIPEYILIGIMLPECLRESYSVLFIGFERMA